MTLEDQLKVYEYMYSYYRWPKIIHILRMLFLEGDTTLGFCFFLHKQSETLHSLFTGYYEGMRPSSWSITDLSVLQQLAGKHRSRLGPYWFKPGEIEPRRKLLKLAITRTKELLALDLNKKK